MPFLVPAIPAIIKGATDIFGAHSASKSNDKAIAAQTAANQQALDFEKSKYADLNTRLAPYRAAGTASTGRMSDLLGLSGGAGGGAPVRPMAGLLEPKPGDPGYPATGFSGGGTVLLKAPDGTQKAVDPRLVDQYLAHGAVRV